MAAVSLKIALVEDHLMFREVLRKVCVADLGHQIVGEAGDGVRAVEMVRATSPDLLLLDLRLPSLDGFGVLERVRAAAPKLKIIILSSRCDRFAIHAAERMRVNGFVDKNTNTVGALREAIAAVAAGKPWFSEEFRRARAARVADPQSFDKVLSDRERAVLALLAVPHTLEETAGRLGISVQALEKCRFRLLQKLELGTTAELARYARQNGLTARDAAGEGGRLLP